MAVCSIAAVLIGGCSRAPKTFDAVQVAERSDVRVLLSPMTAVPVLAAADRAIVWDRWLAGIRWRDAIAFANAFAGAAAREVPSARPSGARAAVSVASVPLAGDAFLACTRAHESDSAGGYHAVSPGGTYRGAYQFDRSTWNSAALLAGRPDLVGADPAAVGPAAQDAVARALYRERGNQPWGGRC